VNEVRATAIKELAYFIEETILANEASLNLLCGDFNIHREPYGEEMIKFLFKLDKDWVDELSTLDREYNDMLTTLQLGGDLEVTNLWDLMRPGDPCVTIGEVTYDSAGKKVPVDTVLTDADMLKAELALDFIFKIRLNAGHQKETVTIRDGTMQVVKHFVKKGAIGAFGNRRIYG